MSNSNLIKKEPPTPDEIIERLEKDVADVDLDTNTPLSDFENLINNCNWIKHGDGFQYPDFFRYYKASIEDTYTVEIYAYESVELCYCSYFGARLELEFLNEGSYISPTEKAKNITYIAKSKVIASGYTQSGKIYYLKQKNYGEEILHTKFLVLINPPEYKNAVEKLTNMIAKW